MELKPAILCFATEYQIRQRYDQHPNFVRPQPIVLSFRDECAVVKVVLESKIRIVSRLNTAPYCSFAHTLKNYLSDKTFSDCAFPPPCESNNNFKIESFLTAERGNGLFNPCLKDKRLYSFKF